MSETTLLRQVSESAKVPRDPSSLTVDKAALRAIAQAAVEVELFTIPLYLTTLYSIQGMHQITSQGNQFYKGRLWPGAATTVRPGNANEKAFNVIFSVVIQEMLHLQLASNMATAIGVTPRFTSSALQSRTHGWTCYGPDRTVIPHIIDLKDTIKHEGVRVNLGPVSREQMQLFLAIEQPDKDARKDIKKEKLADYFPKVPFEHWNIGDPLPRFGTIGWLYQCYWDYLNLEYKNGTRLWDEVYNAKGQQNDLFNNFDGSGHPMREFKGFETTIALTYKDIAFRQMADAIDAITDQGEGSTVTERVRALGLNLQAVEERYQSSLPALRSDYPNFTDTGTLTASADAVARVSNGDKDHYERFSEVLASMDSIVTWEAWLKQHGPWTAADLVTADYVPDPKSRVPAPAEIAGALNALAHPTPGSPDYYTVLSQAAVGAIAGVTTVLDNYWNASKQASSPVSFPFPSMAGAGDRTAICWAVFGRAPDLSIGLEPPVPGTLYHSCQAIDYGAPDSERGTNRCAPVQVFHTCRGSNGCSAQGGCGFVQPIVGGGSCSSSLVADTAIGMRTFGGSCNPFAGQHYSAPGDNKCAAFGGCAVPISASQLFPKDGTMDLYKFERDGSGWKHVPTGEVLLFRRGESVHDVAWAAYKKVMGLPDTRPPPAPTALRLAFAPST